MRRVLPLLVVLFGCEPSLPAPGETIGTFRFTARLDPGASGNRCLIEGLPSQIDFQALLSYEPETATLYFVSNDEQRIGTLDGAHITLRVPAEGEGIPRELPACTLGADDGGTRCPLAFTEEIVASLLPPERCAERLGIRTRADANEKEDVEEEERPRAICPRPLEDGSLDWSQCECIVGTLRELVSFLPTEEPCSCTFGGQRVPAPESCQVTYLLEGRPG